MWIRIKHQKHETTFACYFVNKFIRCLIWQKYFERKSLHFMIPFSVSVSKPGLFMKKFRNRSLILPLLSLGEIFGSSNVTPLSKLLAVIKRPAFSVYIRSKTNNLCCILFTDHIHSKRESNVFSFVCDSVHRELGSLSDDALRQHPPPFHDSFPRFKRNRLYCLFLS